MEQYAGVLRFDGEKDTFDTRVEKLRDNTKYEITDLTIHLSASGLQGYDKIEGYIVAGNIQSVRFYFTRKTKSYLDLKLEGANSEYQRNGINGLRPFRYNGSTLYGHLYITYECTAKLKDTVLPTISNLNIDSSAPRKDIVVTWQSERQEKYEITAVTGGNTIYTKTGNTETMHTIPANTFADGQKVDITVKVLYSDNGNLSSSAWASEKTSITLKQPTVKISQFKPTGTINPLADINVSWECETQATYKLELISDNKVIKTYTGTTLKIVTIPANTIYNGLIDF